MVEESFCHDSRNWLQSPTQSGSFSDRKKLLLKMVCANNRKPCGLPVRTVDESFPSCTELFLMKRKMTDRDFVGLFTVISRLAADHTTFISHNAALIDRRPQLKLSSTVARPVTDICEHRRRVPGCGGCAAPPAKFAGGAAPPPKPRCKPDIIIRIVPQDYRVPPRLLLRLVFHCYVIIFVVT